MIESIWKPKHMRGYHVSTDFGETSMVARGGYGFKKSKTVQGQSDITFRSRGFKDWERHRRRLLSDVAQFRAMRK